MGFRVGRDRPFFPPKPRPSLMVGSRHDAAERAADAFANAVMTGRPVAPPDAGREGVLRRACTPSTQAEGPAPSMVHEALSGPGHPLETGARRFIEARGGVDLSQIRIHTDERAAQSADAVGARAYTVGHDLVFGRNEYQPDTLAGRRLIAHEVGHVGSTVVRREEKTGSSLLDPEESQKLKLSPEFQAMMMAMGLMPLPSLSAAPPSPGPLLAGPNFPLPPRLPPGPTPSFTLPPSGMPTPPTSGFLTPRPIPSLAPAQSKHWLKPLAKVAGEREFNTGEKQEASVKVPGGSEETFATPFGYNPLPVSQTAGVSPGLKATLGPLAISLFLGKLKAKSEEGKSSVGLSPSSSIELSLFKDLLKLSGKTDGKKDHEVGAEVDVARLYELIFGRKK